MTGGKHIPVFRHVGHIAPSVHGGLGVSKQYGKVRLFLMAQMPALTPVIMLPSMPLEVCKGEENGEISNDAREEHDRKTRGVGAP